MATSKGSSTRETTSSPSESEVLRALHAPDLPLWSEEPLAALLAERLGTTPRAVRPALETIEVRVEIAGPVLGQLDETWLCRAPAGAKPFEERIGSVEGVVGWEVLGDRYAIVRTLAQDAVERERRLRDLYTRLHERPLLQLHRAHAAPPKRKLARADWAILSAMRRKPFAPIDVLVAESGATARVVKERAPKLAVEGLGCLVATPRSAPLARLVLKLSPSSSAAARHAIDALGDAVLRAEVPSEGEATLVDALVLATSADWPALRERALDVPGVASAEILAIARSWRDDAAFDALVKRAFSLAAS